MKAWITVGIVLMVMGLTVFTVAMVSNGFEFAKLGTVRYETNTHEIKDEFSKISIDISTANIILLPSEDGKCRVECYEEEKIKHTVSVKDGTLSIVSVDEREWYDYIGINFDSAKITVYLPKNEYESLTIRESTGRVTIPSLFTFGSIDIKTSTGDVDCLASVKSEMKITTSTGGINLEKLTAGALSLEVTTGRVTVSDVSCEGDISVKVSTGDCILTNTSCKKLSSIGSTGDVTLEKVIASESFFIKRSTGDVHFVSSDAADIFVKTDTGYVKGSLLTKKVFITDSSTGKINVPKTTEGGKCEIITDTGDITLNVLS